MPPLHLTRFISRCARVFSKNSRCFAFTLPVNRTARRSSPGSRASPPVSPSNSISSSMNFAAVSSATVAAAARKSRRIALRLSRASATDKRSARLSRCASKIAIGRIGSRLSPWKPRQAPEDAQRRLTAPRPGHADLAGALKFNLHDARYILERASARETAARTAAGALAKQFLAQFGVTVLSHTIAVGKIKASQLATWEDIIAICADLESPLRCTDSAAQDLMKAEVDSAHRAGDSVGGIFEVIAHNVPPGLGSYAQWDEKLDARLAQAMMSIQAVKAVEIGVGVSAATSRGSEVQDEIAYDSHRAPIHTHSQSRGWRRRWRHERRRRRRPWIPQTDLHFAASPQHADLVSKEAVRAAYERSDTCVVPAAGVAGEAMIAFVLAQAFLEKFGGDSLPRNSP